MNLSAIQYIQPEDCVGDSRDTLNTNFQLLTADVYALQQLAVVAYPKGRLGLIRVGNGLSITADGTTSVNLDPTYFFLQPVTNNISLTLSFLNNTFVKKTGDVLTGTLNVTGPTPNISINTPIDTNYKLDVAGRARFQGEVNLPTAGLPAASVSNIVAGNGVDASYSSCTTVLNVSPGFGIRHHTNGISIVFNSFTGDIRARGSLYADGSLYSSGGVYTPRLRNSNGNNAIDINSSLIVDLSGQATFKYPAYFPAPTDADNTTRAATTGFVQSNLDTVKTLIQETRSIVSGLSSGMGKYVLKAGDNTTGHITVIDPVAHYDVVHKGYVDNAVRTITDICSKLSVLTTFADFITIRIDRQPINVVVNEPTPAQLIVHALPDNISYLPISYQWKKDGVSVSGGTGTVLTAAESGNYCCVCSNVVSTLTSVNALVTVNRRVLITVNPISQTLTTQVPSANLSVVATGSGPFTYQWQKNNINIVGATLSTYTATQAGRYKCLVSNMVNTAISTDAIISETLVVAIDTTSALTHTTITPSGRDDVGPGPCFDGDNDGGPPIITTVYDRYGSVTVNIISTSIQSTFTVTVNGKTITYTGTPILFSGLTGGNYSVTVTDVNNRISSAANAAVATNGGSSSYSTTLSLMP